MWEVNPDGVGKRGPRCTRLGFKLFCSHILTSQPRGTGIIDLLLQVWCKSIICLLWCWHGGYTEEKWVGSLSFSDPLKRTLHERVSERHDWITT